MESHWNTVIESSHIIVIKRKCKWMMVKCITSQMINTRGPRPNSILHIHYIHIVIVIAFERKKEKTDYEEKFFSSFVVLLFALKWDIIGNLNDVEIFSICQLTSLASNIVRPTGKKSSKPTMHSFPLLIVLMTFSSVDS